MKYKLKDYIENFKKKKNEQKDDFIELYNLIKRILKNKEELTKENLTLIKGKSFDAISILLHLLLVPTFPVSFTVIKTLLKKININIDPKLRFDIKDTDEEKPYEEINVDESYSIRNFPSGISENYFKWHIDEEDRIIKPITNSSWKFQEDNKLPTTLNENIKIKKGTFHRILKGDGDLRLLIKKLK